jgi:hypothetical protein
MNREKLIESMSLHESDVWDGPDKPHKVTEPFRKFETGATRDTELGKHDPEGFLSPLVIDRFDEYMHKNRLQKDGTLRDSDNWQKGIPLSVYMKSLWRHFLEVWKWHRGLKTRECIEDALCALIFNAQGMLHEILKRRHNIYKETFEEARDRIMGGSND